MFDINKLTLGEIAKFEDLANCSVDMLERTETPKGKALAALAFVIKRRTGDPKFTWAQAQELTMTEAQEILGIGDDDTEEPTGDKTATEPAPKAPKRASAPKK